VSVALTTAEEAETVSVDNERSPVHGLEKSVPATSWAVFTGVAVFVTWSPPIVSGPPPLRRYDVNAAPVYVMVVVGLAADS